MTKNDALPFPTILIIDGAEREYSAVALLRRGEKPEIASQPVKAQELPVMIGELLAHAGCPPAGLKAVALVKREGSVTATRIATATANTLAWLERLPILEVEADSLETAVEALSAGRYAAAVKNSLPFA